MSGKDNLKPFNELTEEEQRIIASKGGKASVKARKEKKLMSQIYADFLCEEFDITVEGKKEKLSGNALISQVMKKVLARGDSASVSLMKEVREATEGNKVVMSGELETETVININGVKTES